jgi:Leucine-rich repeat (LRR) protein
MTSIIVHYENPQIIYAKCKKIIECNVSKFTNNAIHMEFNLDHITMCVQYDNYYSEIDLAVWADKLFHVKKIVVKSSDNLLGYGAAHNVTGFENYPNLRVLNIGNGTRKIDALTEYLTKSLNGLEFCHNLESLNIINNNISDLSPIINLNLISLEIAYNPISSLTPINFKTLKHLTIDLVQLDFLDDDCDLSALDKICIYRSYGEDTEPLKVIEIMQKYPHLNHKECYVNMIMITKNV